MKRLFIIGTCCFFPGGLVGLLYYKKSPALAAWIFRWSIYVFIFALTGTGIFTVIMGGRFIPVLGSFY